MQEQKSDSPPVENDPIDVDTQTVDPPVQQTIDGKKVIYLVYLPTTIIIFWNISLMSANNITESLEPIQPDTIGASSAIPSPQIETTLEKVLYLLILLIFKQLLIS